MTRGAAVGAYVLVGVIWGTTFLFMRLAMTVITPGQTAVVRVAFGALPVAAYAIARRHVRWEHLRHWPHFVVMSVLAASFYYYAFAEGTRRLDTGVAGALSGSIPMFAIVGALLLVRGTRLGRGTVIGLVAGLVGVLLIAEPWRAGFVDVVGVWWMLSGCLSVGLSFAYAHRFVTPLGIHPSASAAYQLVIAAVAMLLVTDLDGVTDLLDHPVALAGTVLGLGLVCTGVAFVLYYVIVTELGAATASTASYLPPAVAAVIGVVVLGEPLRPWGLVGIVLIVTGAVVSQRSGRPAVPEPTDPPLS